MNVASQCGLTPLYEGLQKVHAEHAPRGFAVLGFPCNQFAGQEPGSDIDVKTFCTANYGVIKRNFAKLLVDRRGRVVARFDPKTAPSAPISVRRSTTPWSRPVRSRGGG
ncbi:MAG TPA: hypothetical protein VN646_02040 [Candidatus Acidoferrum sp.]|nr:hypothetical protein [Candidatus Acidoferrum sp.]